MITINKIIQESEYFQKPYILLDLLNQNKELTEEELIEKMNRSKTTIKNLIKKFNEKEKAITYNNGKYTTEKKKLEDCISYRITIDIINIILQYPELITIDENLVAKQLKIDRKELQTAKAIIKSMPAMKSSDSDELGEL